MNLDCSPCTPDVTPPRCAVLPTTNKPRHLRCANPRPLAADAFCAEPSRWCSWSDWRFFHLLNEVSP